jgi:RNA polymerase sigma-B factor
LTALAAAPRGRKSHDVENDAARLRRYAAERRPEDREWLVERYLPLAKHVAARYSGGSEPLEDLQQVASLGLVKAIDRFDPSRAVSFSSYAVPTIAGELRRYFRDHTWSLRVPRDVQELAVKIGKVEAALQLDLGRAPTAAELSDRLDCTVEQLLEARDAAGANRMSSLDQPVSSDDDEGASLADLLGEADAGLEHVERALTVDAALACLDERDRTILRLRFQEELTQAAIGERVGLSQMHVSRLIRQALATLRDAAEPGDGLREAA